VAFSFASTTAAFAETSVVKRITGWIGESVADRKPEGPAPEVGVVRLCFMAQLSNVSFDAWIAHLAQLVYRAFPRRSQHIFRARDTLKSLEPLHNINSSSSSRRRRQWPLAQAGPPSRSTPPPASIPPTPTRRPTSCACV
jgi:hypothetical protein